VLRQGLIAAPQDPGVHHALGLALVRLKRMPEALVELRRAASLPPERPRYDYVYAVALTGRADRRSGSAAAPAHPGNREILEASCRSRQNRAGCGGPMRARQLTGAQ
jgi:hypothetical protein